MKKILSNNSHQKEIEKILKLKGRAQWLGNLRLMRKNRFDFPIPEEKDKGEKS